MSKAVNEVMFGKMTRLKDTFRYSAQSVIVRESVAEHSFWVAMIGATIAWEVEPNSAADVALKGIFHDIEECMTGDLVRDMKYATEEFRDVVKQLERQFLSGLESGLGLVGHHMFSTWETAKQWRTGEIVALADALSVMAYCVQERELGNTKLYEIHDNVVQLIHDKFNKDMELWPIAKEAIDESYVRITDARA